MRVICDPAIEQWTIGDPHARDARRGAYGLDRSARESLVECVNHAGLRLGASRLRPDHPIIASGHQAWLWHPGILAKDLAVRHGADRLGAQPLHVVVDQDVHDVLQLDLPVRRGDRLEVQRIQLAPSPPDVPAGCAPPVDAEHIQATLRATQRELGSALQVDVQPLIEAFDDGPPVTTLAEQVAVVLSRLREPYTGPMPLLFASQLGSLEVFAAVVQQMLAEPSRCVQRYNRAVHAHPAAAVAALSVERDRVELPLWWLAWGRPRRRVYADMSDTRTELQLESGEPVSADAAGHQGRTNDGVGGGWLAPRALLMTALLRRYACELFVHGMGGGRYDRVTDQWWLDWRGERLAPLAVVTADLTLDFDVPVSDQNGLTHAVWWAHHLPHNIDRGVGSDAPDPAEVARKRSLIAGMDADRDPRRRAESFSQIHAINRELAQNHPGVLAQSQDQLQQVKMGFANRAVAHKRDWCFALYDPEQLLALSDRFRAAGLGGVGGAK